MSDTNLHAVLNMPPEIWSDSDIDKLQRHSCYIEASQRIEDLSKALLSLVYGDCDWPICVSDEYEELIRKLVVKAEGG